MKVTKVRIQNGSMSFNLNSTVVCDDLITQTTEKPRTSNYIEVEAGIYRVAKRCNVIAFHLLKNDFQNMKIFDHYNLVYLYIEEIGYYVKMVYKEFKVVLSGILRPHLEALYSSKLLDEVWGERQFHDKSVLGVPEFDNQYLVFDNGTLNLVTEEFINHTPTVFTTYRMMYIYDPKAIYTPVFDKFVDDLCCGH